MTIADDIDTGAATAWSMGGRAFEFQAHLTDPLPLGGFVSLHRPDGSAYLGQIQAKRLDADGGPRMVRGSGALLASATPSGLVAAKVDGSFDTAELVPAEESLVRSWLESGGGKTALLDLGRLQGGQDIPARLKASGFNRHTFLCGQSGSGKTYTLGVILEQLLMKTSLTVLVLDPNSDYVHLDELPAVGGAEAAHLADRICVFGTDGRYRLKIRFGRLPLKQSAMVLQLDPIATAEEFDVFRRASDAIGTPEHSLADVRKALDEIDEPASRRLALRIDNLGVAGWSTWAGPDDAPVFDQLPENYRAAIVDLGSISGSAERSVVAASTLAAVWERRHLREPTLVMIDEAHNVCPRDPSSPSEAMAVEHAIKIAAEGRKYGIYLLLASQRPQKLHVNVLSQCENLLLMKTVSGGDLNHLAGTFSHAPAGLIAQATGFGLGEGLAVGRIAPTPLMFASGRRLAPEGGADIPTTWAQTPI